MDDVIANEQNQIWLGRERQVNDALELVDTVERRTNVEIGQYGNADTVASRRPRGQ
jgi:hypothetical protein